ncbi:cadherin EGF LAG seven-pass G-type receptor 2-like isoform X3 [Anneissia japonica]|uniref:cadherin EGF LAG seven-pass G-type receptor 2-like isoform X3 n=1 Tax=Anneissia japonica TaxID=1529436 RepID=UPI001425A307|nr:cadherin EGF LAG seven-pass G-type receptor 2-like isoform X3 [Anneissia japonica]
MGYHRGRLFAYRLPYLWWFLCGGLTVLNVCPSVGYNIHISDSMDVDELIFNATVGDSWNYSIFDKMSSSLGKYLLTLSDHSGELRLKRKIDCLNQLPKFNNPFTIYIEATNKRTANSNYKVYLENHATVYSLVPVTVHVHGKNCHWKANIQANSYLQREIDSQLWPMTEHMITVNYPPGNCWMPGSPIVPLYDFLPASLRECSDLLYSVLDHYGAHIGMILDPLTGELKAWPSQKLCLNYSKYVEMHYSLGLHAGTQCNAARDYSLFLIPIKLTISAETSKDPTQKRFHNHNSGIGHESRRRRVRRSTRNSNPVFAQQEYSGSVFENEDPGYIIETIVATDSDSGPAGELTYSMEAYADVRSISKFTIGPTDGIVRTLETLDREFISEHKFRIVATDRGDPPGSAMAILTINVLDKNDHTPEFELHDYHEQVEEGLVAGTTVATVHATDGDYGPNSEITYQILNPEPPNDVFTIQSSGAITTRKKLDRETIETYTLNIQASDNGNPSHSSTAEVVITVLDVNDNSPQFSQRNYEVDVEENAGQNQVLLQISATDKDLNRNQEIRYSLYSGNDQGLFMIDSLNGDLTLIRELDYEMKNTHRLVVKALDSGAQSLSNTTSVIVNVIDVNDNAPAFTGNLYQQAVSESVNVGHQVMEINAFDQDSGENGRLTYSIENVDPNFPFTIDVVAGRVFITTSSELDRETIDEYRFNVRVVDNGDPQLSATTSVIIRITDVNDNPPTFPERRYDTTVDEDANSGTRVITITAEDPDSDNYVSYQITAGNLRNRFSIRTQENQGQILVFQSLDYNQERRFALTIEASDGQLSDTCTVFINVSDANTYAPVFNQAPYRVNVPEDVPIGHIVVRVMATDGDTGENARIEYSMDLEQTFEVDPVTGDVKTKLLLDRESQTSYSLRIKARDHGNPVKQKFTNVEITVTDINDNDPVFRLDSYAAEILENVSSRHSVIQISASDKDEGTFGAVTYTFEGGNDGDGKFEIESSSGIIRTCTVCKLDREEVPVYNLVAIAKDGGMRETSVPVLVTLLDVNDNMPSFGTDELEMHISEDSDIGSIVGIVQATDADTGSNAIITYEIVYEPVENLFILDAYTGELTTNGYLDYEARSSYTLSLKATSKPFFTTVFLTVYVDDVNDNAPLIENFDIYFNNYVGHFPKGETIGNVPARDPDVADTLTYHIVDGNRNNILFLDSKTGGIQLNPDLEGSNIPGVVTFTVKVTDGVNEKRAICNFHNTLITEEMFFSSVTVQLENISSSEFLRDKLLQFIDALAAIIPAEKTHVFLFSVRDDLTGHNVLNVTFAAQKTDRTFFQSQYLQERVYLKRAELSRVSGANVLPFGDNLCLNEICSYYSQCISPFVFTDVADFISVETVIFRPVHPEVMYRCDCPLGFTGNYCKTEINFCYSNPCGNNGECIQKEAGYTCMCYGGFTGVNCEINYNEDRCEDEHYICKNGGSCANFLEGGFECICEVGFDEPWCDMRTRNFPERAFLMFYALTQRIRLKISLSFATLTGNGLLFYNGRYNQRNDFIALEIINDTVQFSFSVRDETTKVEATIPGGVSDGEWHTVHVDYLEKGADYGIKTATIAIDDCDIEVALHFESSENTEYRCAARATQDRSEKKFLDLTGPFIIGGLPAVPDPFQVTSTDFIGCIRDVTIDNNLLDLASSVEDYLTQPGCGAKENYCRQGGLCKNGGTCVSKWNTYQCMCREGYTGQRCEQGSSQIMRFDGMGVVRYEVTPTGITLPWKNAVSFRTRALNGLLMYIKVGSVESQKEIFFEIENGYVQYRYHSNVIARINSVQVNDGEWHYVEAEWKNRQVVVKLDYGKETETETVVYEIAGSPVRILEVGGKNTNEENVEFGFSGCIQGVKVGSLTLIVDDSNTHNVADGCDYNNPCESNPCPDDSRCIDDWMAYHCECNTAHFGPECSGACELDICKHGSSCSMNLKTEMGYECECSKSFYGDYCENRVEQCSNGLWGFPICGPCNCDPNLRENSACNKTTGECTCRAYHYRKGEQCLPCNCYGPGSYGPECGDDGQCLCLNGVIGERCDDCTDPFGEVIDGKGCEVVYDSCPRRFKEGLWWPRTKFNKVANVRCPNGTIGDATRRCDINTGWLDPDLFMCTSISFQGPSKTLKELDSGQKLNKALSIEVVTSLESALQKTGKLYGNDVSIGYKLLNRVLEHESKQKGLNVTATQESTFIGKVISSLNHLLDDANQGHWSIIQQGLGGTADLMKNFELFSINIPRESDSITYTPNFTYATENVVMRFQFLERNISNMTTIPQYEKDDVVDHTTRILLPKSAIQPKPTVTGPSLSGMWENVAVASFILYTDLGKLLPMTGDHTVELSCGSGCHIVVNTPVVSLSLFDALANGTVANPLPDPIIIEFKLDSTLNKTNPQCVFWDFTMNNESGGWSSKGCSLQGQSKEKVSCACNHLTNFAVLMTFNPSPVHAPPPMALDYVVNACLSISLLALMMALFSFTCLSHLYSNLNSIHVNVVISLVIAEIIFMIGISSPNESFCTFVAITLHFTLLSVFSWMFIEFFHLYRMMTEIRNINHGQMTFYYLVGYGIPGIIVCLAVPLSIEEYSMQINNSNEHFCWLSINHKLIWSFAAPVIATVFFNLVLFIMAIRVLLQSTDKNAEFAGLKALMTSLCAAAILSPVICITWVFGLLAVNKDNDAYYYLFAVFCCLQGIFIFIFHCLINSKARYAWWACCMKIQGKKVGDDLQSNATISRSNLAYKSSEGNQTRFNVGISTNSTSSRSASKTSSGNIYRPEGYLRTTASTSTATPSYDYYPAYYQPRQTNLDDPSAMQVRPPLPNLMEQDSDSDSDASVRQAHDSMSLASSHSSDEDDEVPDPKWNMQPKTVNTDVVESQPPVPGPYHSTPKGYSPVPVYYYTTVPGMTLEPEADNYNQDAEPEGYQRNAWPSEGYSATASDTESRAGSHKGELQVLDVKLTPEKENSQTESPTGSIDCHQNLNERPDILPIRGIMKNSDSSRTPSITSLTRTAIPLGMGGPDKLGLKMRDRTGHMSESEASSNETSV